MLSHWLNILAICAGSSLAKPTLQTRDSTSITRDTVDELDLYSQYSAATYCNYQTPAGEPVRCEVNCDRVLEDNGTIVRSFYTGPGSDIAGYVAVVPTRKQIIFAARGTASNKNWETNLNFFSIKSELAPGVRFHGGFYNAWSLLENDVRKAIDEAQAAHDDYSFVVTGHSLGGAIATIAAAYLRADGYSLDLYTYGQPRVGNEAASDFITQQPGKLYRVTHGADPVPRLPPTWLGYRHTSPEVWLVGNSSLEENWPLDQIKVCEGSLNKNCNANPAIKFDAVDHGVYFGRMGCLNESTGTTKNGVFVPENVKRSLEGLEEVDRSSLASRGEVLPFILPDRFNKISIADP